MTFQFSVYSCRIPLNPRESLETPPPGAQAHLAVGHNICRSLVGTRFRGQKIFVGVGRLAMAKSPKWQKGVSRRD